MTLEKLLERLFPGYDWKEMKGLIDADYRNRVRICRQYQAEIPDYEICAREFIQMELLGDNKPVEWTDQAKWEHATFQRLTQYQSPKVVVEKENG